MVPKIASKLQRSLHYRVERPFCCAAPGSPSRRWSCLTGLVQEAACGGGNVRIADELDVAFGVFGCEADRPMHPLRRGEITPSIRRYAVDDPALDAGGGRRPLDIIERVRVASCNDRDATIDGATLPGSRNDAQVRWPLVGST